MISKKFLLSNTLSFLMVVLNLMSQGVYAGSDELVISQGKSRVIYLKSEKLNTATFAKNIEASGITANLAGAWSMGKECRPLIRCKKLIISISAKAKIGRYKVHLLKKDADGGVELVGFMPLRVIANQRKHYNSSVNHLNFAYISEEDGKIMIKDGSE